MKKGIYTILILITCIGNLFAGAFDNTGLNARPMGMGEAFTSISGENDSIMYNPAGLSELNTAKLFLSYRDFYGLKLISQKYACFSVPERYFNFGFSWHRIGATDNVDFFDYKEDTYILTISGRLGGIENLSGGMNFKFFRVYSECNASGYGLDMGLQYYLMDKRLRLGLFNKDIGNTSIYWDTGSKDVLKTGLWCGVSYMPLEWVLVAMDVGSPGELNIGSEAYLFENRMTVRGGIKELNKKNVVLSSGISLILNKYKIDYSLTGHNVLGITHFFTVTFNIKRGVLE